MSEKLVWGEESSFGIGILDEQHKLIIRMINTLESCSGSPNEAEAVSETLTEMIHHAKEHFAEEEHFMREHGYPELDAHHVLHKDFLHKIVRFSTAAHALVPGLAERLQTYLVDWFSQHVLFEDMKIKEFVEDKRTRNVGA